MVKKHSISVISNSCGVKPHTLRIWEKRYHLFTPERTASGQRLYDNEDIIKAKLIVSLIDSGYSISSLAELSIEQLKSLNDQMSSERIESKKTIDSKRLKIILDLVGNYRIDAIGDELQHARLSTGTREFILDLILPVIRETGMLVAKGKYSITQEHIISTIIRDQLSQIYLPNFSECKTYIALATPEGNLHEFSILIADILCRTHRLSTRYLGATHPAICLAEAINALKTPILVLGVISSDQWNYQNNIISYLQNIDASITEKIIVILGGGQEMKFPEFENIKEIKILKTFEEFDQYLEGLQ